MSEADYSEIGELLRHARRDMRMSIDEAATRLHIRPRYLELLEAGKFNELPGLSYTKGYLARYATFLRLDKDEILRRFERVEDVIGRRGFYLPLTFSKEKKPSQTMVWGALAAAFVLYVAWSQVMSGGHGEAPLVESPEAYSAKKMLLSAQMLQQVPCLAPQERLYPPCNWKEPGSSAMQAVMQGQYEAALKAMEEKSIERLANESPAAGGLPWLNDKEPEAQTQPEEETSEEWPSELR